MTEDYKPPQSDEVIGKLIAAAGRGPTASPEARERIYAAVHKQWNEQTNRASSPASRADTVTSIANRRRFTRAKGILAIAASVASVAIVLSLLETDITPDSSPEFPQFSQLEGDVILIRGNETVSLASLETADPLLTGDILRTSASGRAELQREDGLLVRINVASELELSEAGRFELIAGTVYVDSGTDAAGTPLQIITPLGEVQHLGTQYEVHVADTGLRVRVREGRVSIEGDSVDAVGVAGNQLEIAPGGATTVTAIAPNDDAWAWATDLATLPARAEYELVEVLEWIAREQGLALEYADLASRNAVRNSIVFGLDGLSPSEALDVITRTTATSIDNDGEHLLISNQAR